MKPSVDLGLLVLRVGLGVVFVIHGWPKISGGPTVWEGLGMAMGVFGIRFAPTLWGLLAACSEFIGGLCLIVGLATRPAAFFMAMTMLVATAMHLHHGDGFATFSHPIKAGVAFLALLLTGPGAYRLDALWLGRADNDNGRFRLPSE